MLLDKSSTFFIGVAEFLLRKCQNKSAILNNFTACAFRCSNTQNYAFILLELIFFISLQQNKMHE